MSCVIVLGFYRTGSSAIAGILHHLGVFMGDDFDPPNDNNPQGYWEDLEFKHFHKAILDGEDVEQRYIDLIQKREEHKIWGVKDPLLCLLLPNLIKNLRTQYRIIHITRDVDDIQTSIHKSIELDPIDFRATFEVYQRYKQQWLSSCSCSILHIDFSEIFSDSVGTIDRIADFVQLPATAQALSFIQPRGHLVEHPRPIPWCFLTKQR